MMPQTPSTPDNPQQERRAQRRHARRGSLKPGRWQVRLMISLPSILVLLIIAMGFAYYASALNLSSQLEELQSTELRADHPEVATRLANLTLAAPNKALILLLLFSFIGLLSGLGLVFSILQPLKQITDAAATIARGRIQQRVNINAGFELGELGRNFNSMVQYINSMIEQRDAILKADTKIGTMTIDQSGRLSTMSPYGLDMLKIRSDNLIGKTLGDIRTQYPDVAPNLFEFIQDCYIAFEAARDSEPDKISSILPDRPVEIEEPPTGDRAEQVYSIRCSALRNERNEPEALMFHFRDAVSLRNLNDLFSHTDQLAALGTFTFGLSHELRNPLGAIKGTSQLLEESIGERDECRPFLDRIVQEVNRLDLLVRELYDFSRTPVDPREPQDINNLTRMAVEEARATQAEEILQSRELEEAYADNLPKCIGQQTRIVRAIANIISNAYEHTPEGHRILVKTESHSAQGPVQIEITNTGSKIPEENIEKIFEPFFSTRERGTGLGLAIAYQSVIQNHGQLTVQSTDNSVTFRFAFHRLVASAQLTPGEIPS